MHEEPARVGHAMDLGGTQGLLVELDGLRCALDREMRREGVLSFRDRALRFRHDRVSFRDAFDEVETSLSPVPAATSMATVLRLASAA
jgi:hypothetical protein